MSTGADLDMTGYRCGACGEEFTTNCTPDDIACPECESIRCEFCGKWSGTADETVTEYGLLMSGGGYHIRWDDPEMERIYPAAEWIVQTKRAGGHVFRRRVIVVEEWTEL